MPMWNDSEISFEESLRNILPAMASRIEERMPSEGKMRSISYRFDVDASYIKEGVISFEYDSLRLPKGRIVKFGGIFPDGSGKKMEQYIFEGTKEEIVQYLKEEERIPEILKMVKELDDAIKKHD